MNELQKIVESNQGIEVGIEALLKQMMANGQSMDTAIEALIKQAKDLKDADESTVAIQALIKLSKQNHKEMMDQMQRNDPPVDSDFDMRLKGKGHIVIHGKDGEDGKDGKDGEKGDQGERGLKGEAGDDGDSAYQVWLKAGNKGSEADFLKTLKGDKGERGERGFKGEKGDRGEKGDQGVITAEQLQEAALLAKAKAIESLSAMDLANKIKASDKPIIPMDKIIGLDDALKRYAGYNGGGGSNYFLNLMDGIKSYVGKAGQTIVVNADENGLTTSTAGAGDLLAANNLSDLDSASTARTNLGLAIGSDVQAYSAILASIAGLTPASSLIIGNGLGGFEMVTPANFITNNNILDTADIGVLVQAYDADLAALAGLTSASDRLPYFTGSGTASLATFTSFARTLLDDADAATMRTTLGVDAAGTDNAPSASTTTAGKIEIATDAEFTTGTDTSRATTPDQVASVAQTMTNKRITPRIGTTTSSSSLTIDSDSYDHYTVTALAAAMTINSPSGTPTDGQRLVIRILDNSTARALTWNAAFRAIGVTLPTTTTIDKTIYVGCMWNSADSKWDVIAVAEES